jgi:hypothetical protein
LIDSSVAIKFIEFVKNDISAITIDSRSGIYDLACVDENDNHFIVEMQLSVLPRVCSTNEILCLTRFQHTGKERGL